ncbi:MAG: hypothetical protein KME42_00810 [Tildeniella nuda ZEHNDER 1965/U140]|nr:hypothetical protein [Tildeniella nuda ZEHNDER 1965/U140]
MVVAPDSTDASRRSSRETPSYNVPNLYLKVDDHLRMFNQDIVKLVGRRLAIVRLHPPIH